MKYFAPWFVSLALVFSVIGFSKTASADAIDAIVATVDEEPILLSELNKQLPRPLTMTEAANDPAARTALDRLIFESLIASEAEARRVTVSDADIERYVDEVANRNSLSREGFVEALKAQGKDWTTYRNQVRSDILQTRLASIMLQGLSTVKEEELNSYFEAHPDLLQRGRSVSLRRFVTLTKETAEEFANKELSADEFIEVVKSRSIAADAADGGSLGNVAERDLAPSIFESLMQINPGSTSGVVSDPTGNTFTVYYLEQRSSGSEEDQKLLRERVKRELSQAKLAQQMEGVFQTELFKNHTIDKKI